MESTAYSNAPDLENTSERQAALRRYHILDTAPEKDFDHITSLVAKVCDVSSALISLIDEERQWFKSCFNFDARQTDIGVSFCVHAVHDGELLVVEDATKDPRFKDNPIVTGPPHIRFYAGAPLTTPEGVHIGTLCIIDYEPKTFDAAQREILERLADTVVGLFEHRSAEAQVRQLVEENPQPLYVSTKEDGTLLDANAAAREEYGYDASAFQSLTTADLRAPDDAQPAAPEWEMHQRADGSHFSARLRTRDVLYNGHNAQLTVVETSTEPMAGTEVVVQVDADGIVQSLSEQWAEATGVSVGDAVGSSLLDLVQPPDRAATEDVLAPVLAGDRKFVQHEASFFTEWGERSFELRGRPVLGGDDEVAGIMGTLTPVEPKRAADDEDAAADPEDDAAPEDAEAEAPGADTGDAAPESTVPDPPVPSASAEPSGEAAPDVFSPSLPDFDSPGDSSRASSAPPNEPDGASPEPFDLVDRVRTLLEERMEDPEARSVTLESSLPDDPVLVRLSADVVDELVGALLDNALENTEAGTVAVDLTPGEDDVRIVVADTGTGVEERFMEVYMNAAEGASGGLQSVQQQASRIGGSMNMEDADDGTRFILTLPRSSGGRS
jgi:PAS domain S-box-containing protein